MDVDHPLITGGGYDYESVALVGLKTWMNPGKSCEEHRSLAFEADGCHHKLRSISHQ